GRAPSMTVQRNILVVDDVDINRRILSKILRAEDFNTIEAENGQVALDILTSGNPAIALVLLDITMPVMNGYELLEKMKETGLLTSIPVIVTTGSDQNNAEVKSLEYGATDFITKPYKPDIVSHRVRSILRLCENAALLNRLEIDRLTGVYSREFFYRHAEAVLDEHPNEKYDIICSNIENFKMINAKYGMEVGDELLRYVAKHNVDCVGADGVCGRLSADSFVVLRKRRSQHTQEEIGRQFTEAFRNAPVKNFLMQYGLYPIEDRSMPIPSMCDCAQLALATIKHKYGVHYAVYDESIRQKMLREHQLSDYMEQALEAKQFLVYLQPKHDIETCAIAGAEALVRWIHPELGFISPGEFIPLFERNGFITKLDRYIWEEVCRILRRWIQEGRKPIPISVNASRVDFEFGDLAEKIEILVDSYDIPHDLLHFEVTESAYTDNPQQIISTVSTLRDMGFLIEMDDFGSGYSSLNMLSELPIDMLKLDMRFMQKGDGLLPNSKRSILSFIVSLSKWLQLPTIAEGVETKEDVDVLRTMGCNYIQGYYFAKPMPVSEFETYWEAKRRDVQTVPEPPIYEILHAALSKAEARNKPHVLIVEDIASNRELMKEILSPFYVVADASDGQQAYRYIKERHAELSCILLDLLMPVMDGFQLLDLLRKEGFLMEVPVIITSEAGSDSELRALHLGADSFVAKPYNGEILLHHVQKAVNEHEYRRLCGKLE
ncbi:MAG: EAL domain-containing protein, partial [Sphaerochaetaceae bacterium]|nr:EAL domain-containing protein [Sphaerochaetaceae bacterium]